jgi:ectoine hydroxylase-related dioxygenase (phytanoyl-CoA dioxygenase family)
MAFYLDAVCGETGSLRVIPGSHCWGDHFADMLHNTLQAHVPGFSADAKDLGVAQSKLPSTALASTPGDVVVRLLWRPTST